MTCKARALYHEFRISTKIISPLEVMTELKTDDNYDVASFFQKQFIEANDVSHDGAGASGDKESMFSGVDELDRYFNETVLDVFKDFDAA